MFSSNKQSITNNRQWSAVFLWTIIVLAFIGLLDATYLTSHHYSGDAVTCIIAEGSGGCETVTTSGYATVAGVPIALFGTIYYGAVFVLAALLLGRYRPLFQKVITVLVSGALVFTFHLVYLQLFVLNAICEYCMVSAATTTILFAIVIANKKLEIRNQKFETSTNDQNTNVQNV